MKDLLTALKAEIQQNISYVRNDDIFISLDESWLPHDVKFPCIGLKDGGVKRTEKPGLWWEEEKEVRITIWVNIRKPELSLVGGAHDKGLLDIIYDDIHVLLDDNFLGLDDVIHAHCPSEAGSQLFAGPEKSFIQQKTVIYKYIVEGDRPSRRR